MLLGLLPVVTFVGRETAPLLNKHCMLLSLCFANTFKLALLILLMSLRLIYPLSYFQLAAFCLQLVGSFFPMIDLVYQCALLNVFRGNIPSVWPAGLPVSQGYPVAIAKAVLYSGFFYGFFCSPRQAASPVFFQRRPTVNICQ